MPPKQFFACILHKNEFIVKIPLTKIKEHEILYKNDNYSFLLKSHTTTKTGVSDQVSMQLRNNLQRAWYTNTEIVTLNLQILVTKKPPMCQIMRLSLYCMNGSLKGRRVNKKNCYACNSDFIARSALLEFLPDYVVEEW